MRGLPPLFTRVRINGIEGLGTTGLRRRRAPARWRHQSQSPVRLQHLRVRPVQQHHGAQDAFGGNRRRITGRNRRSGDRPAVRLSRRLRCGGSAQMGYSDSPNGGHPRFAGLVSGKFADGGRRTAVRRLQQARHTRGRAKHGPLGPGNCQSGHAAASDRRFNAASTLPTGATDWNFFHPRIPRYDSYQISNEAARPHRFESSSSRPTEP